MLKSKLKVKVIEEIRYDFNGPSAIVIDKKNDILILEEFSHRLIKFTPAFDKLWSIGKKGNGSDDFFYPTAITVNSENDYFVSDRWNHRIRKIAAEGKFITDFNCAFENKNNLIEPWGIVALENDDLLIVDRENGKIIKLSKDGKIKKCYATLGVPISFYESDIFKRTTHFNNWIKRVSTLSRLESFFYQANYDVGEFEYPEEIVISKDNKIYVADRANKNITVFSDDLESEAFLRKKNDECLPIFATSFSPSRQGLFVADEINATLHLLNKSMNLSWDFSEVNIVPSGICFDDSSEVLFVADAFNDKVLKIKLEV